MGALDLTATQSLAPPLPGDEGRRYLLVIQGDSSSLFHLPRNGVLLIGRGEETDLHIVDESASRSHAKLIMVDGEARIADLGSHNGTRVNGEVVDGTRVLSSGDVIAIGSSLLILHSASPVPEARQLIELQQFKQRIEEEVERSIEYQHPLGLVAIGLGAPAGDRSAVTHAIASQLRLIDLAAFCGEAHLLLLVPEQPSLAVIATAELVIDVLRHRFPGTCAGVAAYPQDGCSADVLLAAARAALARAQPGEVLPAIQAATRLQLGDREIVMADPAMIRLYQLIERLSASDLPVLVCGETGVGKEHAAFAIHHWSPRSSKPFVTLNCAAVPESLADSELFGHEKGAFTGAVTTKAGRLESVDGGTLFFDEIGELSLTVQAKLLRVLETHKINRVGAVRERDIELRVVAATHRDLEQDVKAGRFRQDLFFRLSAATVIIPPLRERPREIVVLARVLLDAACARSGREPIDISAAAMQRLTSYPWPGNVRELKNIMDYLAVTVPTPVLSPWHLPPRISGSGEVLLPVDGSPVASAGFRPVAEELQALERQRMMEALKAAEGNQTRAAELIGMPLRTFVTKFKVYGLKQP